MSELGLPICAGLSAQEARERQKRDARASSSCSDSLRFLAKWSSRARVECRDRLTGSAVSTSTRCTMADGGDAVYRFLATRARRLRQRQRAGLRRTDNPKSQEVRLEHGHRGRDAQKNLSDCLSGRNAVGRRDFRHVDRMVADAVAAQRTN